MTDSTDNIGEPIHLQDIRFEIPNIKYELKNTFPHDQSAFTEGLFFYEDTFYESTGRYPNPYPASTLRQVEITTGRILRVQVLRRPYFAEGLTIFKGKIFLLTHQHKKGFVYDLDTLVLECVRSIWRLPLFVSVVRLSSGEYVIVVAPRSTQTALCDYARRWEIETLFTCLESRGFRLEETPVTHP